MYFALVSPNVFCRARGMICPPPRQFLGFYFEARSILWSHGACVNEMRAVEFFLSVENDE
jgi:hypothetical protein